MPGSPALQGVEIHFSRKVADGSFDLNALNVTRIFAMPIVSIGDFGSKRVAEVLTKKDEKRSIYRKICLDEKGVIIGAILINKMEDLGVIHGLIQSRKSADILKSNSVWRSPVNYGLVYKNILQGRI